LEGVKKGEEVGPNYEGEARKKRLEKGSRSQGRNVEKINLVY